MMAVYSFMDPLKGVYFGSCSDERARVGFASRLYVSIGTYSDENACAGIPSRLHGCVFSEYIN